MYDEFYGLSGRPFQLTPDPDFYFETATHRKALSYLGYGLAQGEGFIVITGEVGAGKSTLAAHLMATIDRDRLTAAQIVTSKLDAGEIVHVAAHAFGIDVAANDKASALGAIERFLQDEARAGRRTLLVVDESQNLSIAALEELRMLSNFQLGAHPLLQILLLGQPEFRETLQNSPDLEQLRQRVIATHHLEAMDAAEIGPYIEHRLARVGWDGHNPEFEPRVYAELDKASGAIPRRVNQIVNRLLLMGAVEQRKQIDVTMFKAVMADLGRDGALPAPVQAAALARPVAPVSADAFGQDELAPTPLPAPPAAAEQIDFAKIEAVLASRDEQIAELQQAVIELAEMRPAPSAAPSPAGEGRPSDDEIIDALAEAARRITALEAQSREQEQTIRHTLTMLIEWIEGEDPHRAAA
ncbi:XrtA/PEP-CTERM system-associated ATPase [Novosphingobium lentum]|uniref:XrtA/PEP-CTERM system-associated ATPase n=1 Tax=Novosphingobium lentum TaxID=145287 RepID=UPI000829BC96|nr:XrtA/PEP-CTERM system-associated ATPase [Novosphingobium lentum]